MDSSPIFKIDAKDHPIQSATVFKSLKAEIVRCFSISLKAGHNKIEIRGLSSTLDTQTVRVSGPSLRLGEARLIDVVCTIGTGADEFDQGSPDSASPAETLRVLGVGKRALESEKHVREHEASLLVDYAKTIKAEYVPPAMMNEYLVGFVEQGRKNLQEVGKLKEKIIQVERQIKEEIQKNANKKGEAYGKVDIVLGADKPCTIELKLIYVVSNVCWQTMYELHGSTMTTETDQPSSSVLLHYRAYVSQSTGEDWQNTSLTLSTLNVSSHTTNQTMPHLQSIKLVPHATFLKTRNGKVNFKMSDIRCGASPPGLSAMQGGGGEPMEGSLSAGAIEEEVLSAAEEPTTATITETPVSMSFSIPGQSTIPSDGIEHQLCIAVLPFESEISRVTIPRVDPRVYLYCQVKNTSDYRLLAGPVNVILNDSYVSTTSLSNISVGGNFACSLGDDPSIRVNYTRTSRITRADTDEHGSFSARKTTTYTTTIMIHNDHKTDVSGVVVKDAVPVCDDKQVRVVLKKPEGLADVRDGEVVVVGGVEAIGPASAADTVLGGDGDDTKQEQGEQGITVAWEKLVDGKGGEKEGKYEWKVNMKAKDKVTLGSQWEVRVFNDLLWVESL